MNNQIKFYIVSTLVLVPVIAVIMLIHEYTSGHYRIMNTEPEEVEEEAEANTEVEAETETSTTEKED